MEEKCSDICELQYIKVYNCRYLGVRYKICYIFVGCKDSIKTFMKHLFRNILSLLLVLPFVLSSCSASVSPSDSDIEQTILIYMNADNNLTYYAHQDLQEMENGYVPDYFEMGGSGRILLVYLDTSSEKPVLLRYFRDEFGVLDSETIMVYEEQDSSDPQVMNNVLQYAHNLFPSENNGLVLWSHGTGWTPVDFYNNPNGTSASSHQLSREEDPYADYVKSFGYDQGSEMDIIDMAEALPIKYRFILFDACLMGGVEVAYQLRDKCDYFIASVAEILAGGFPYDQILDPLYNDVSERGLETVCSRYYHYYYYQNEGATVSLVKSSELEGLAEVCENIFEDERVFIQSLDMDNMQGFFRLNRHYFYDLGDLISNLASASEYPDFENALSKAVITTYATPNYNINNRLQFEINKNSGLSTYIPNPENEYLDTYYQTLDWNKRVKMIVPSEE